MISLKIGKYHKLCKIRNRKALPHIISFHVVEKVLLQQGNAFTGEYDDMKFLANPMVNMSLVVGGEGDEVKDGMIIYQNQYVSTHFK